MALRTYAGGCPYRIGSYLYTDDKNFNPNSTYSGTTWERVKGQTLVGVDENDTDFETAKKTGGEKAVKLGTSHSPWKYDGMRNSDTGSVWANQGVTTNSSVTAHNNLQPYRTTYIWVRTK